MDLRLIGGHVNAAHYRFLRLDGVCDLDAGVTFDVCIVSGTVTACDCSGGRIICESGCIRCCGGMRVGSIAGHGRLQIGTDLICNEFAFTGVAHVGGFFRCSRTMTMNGRLLNSKMIRADSIDLIGALEGWDIRARSLRVRPLHSGLLSRYGMGEYLMRSRAHTVVGMTVSARGLDCDNLHARTVELSDYSRINHLCSRDGYVGDGTSHVLRLDTHCDGSHLRQPYEPLMQPYEPVNTVLC